jgi:hypothetical protein
LPIFKQSKPSHENPIERTRPIGPGDGTCIAKIKIGASDDRKIQSAAITHAAITEKHSLGA